MRTGLMHSGKASNALLAHVTSGLFFFEKFNCVKVIDIHYRREKQKYFFLSTWREVFV